MIEHNILYALVSSNHVRAFAKSEGIKAKTDPLDAKMLLRFAQEKNRLQNSDPLMHKDINKFIEFIETQIQQVDQ